MILQSDPKYDGYQRGLASMVYNFCEKRSDVATEPNYQLANELHRPNYRKFKRRKFYSSFRDNIWVYDLGGMQSLSKYNKQIKYFSLCVCVCVYAIDLFSTHLWGVPLKDKTGITFVNAFQKNNLKRTKAKQSMDRVIQQTFTEIFENK